MNKTKNLYNQIAKNSLINNIDFIIICLWFNVIYFHFLIEINELSMDLYDLWMNSQNHKQTMVKSVI